MNSYTFTVNHGKRATIALFFNTGRFEVNVDILPAGIYQSIEERISKRLFFRNKDQTPIEIPLNITGVDVNYDIRCCFKNYPFFRDPARLPWIDTFTCTRKPPTGSDYVDMVFATTGRASREASMDLPIEVHAQVHIF